VPQLNQTLIKIEINSKICIMGKLLFDSKAYSLRRSFMFLFLFKPIKENKIKEIVKPYPRKISLKTPNINIMIVITIIKKILIQIIPPMIYHYNKIIEK